MVKGRNGMILILLGAPGAGKGTQAERLVEEYRLHHLSTGELLRTAAAAGSNLGKLAKSYMDDGQLVPDDIFLSIIRSYLDEHQGEGILFDGFPRTVAQADGLSGMLAGRKVVTLALEIPDRMVIDRLSARRVCRSCGKVYNTASGIMPHGGRCNCGDGGELYQRDDDHPETIRKRLEVFHKQTEPIISYYRRRGALRTVNGDGAPDEVFARIKKALG